MLLPMYHNVINDSLFPCYVTHSVGPMYSCINKYVYRHMGNILLSTETPEMYLTV